MVPVLSKNSSRKRVFKDARSFTPGHFCPQSCHLVHLARKIGEVRFSTKIQTENDENQQALLMDPLHVPVGPTTRARSKKIKEALNGPIQDIWADSTTGHSKLGPKEDEGVINLLQAADGADHA